MFRPLINPEKYFPELAGIPKNIQEEIAEQARYQTYMKNGGRKKFVRPYIAVGLLGLVLTVIASTLLIQFFAINTVVVIWIGTTLTVIYSMHLQQENLIKHMRPKVQKLVKRYRLSEN